MLALILVFCFLPPIALAFSVLHVRESVDTSVHCGLFDNVTSSAGTYSLLTNLFGASGASSGSQCAQIVSFTGETVEWTTNWTWTGGNGVKSFTNIQLNANIGRQLSAIESMPSTWEWEYDLSSSAVADVAYDLFTSTTPGGANVNEIMVWLANFNAGPISAVFGADGKPVPISSNLTIAGFTWNLFSGTNGANNVFSFLPVNGTVNSFSGDINAFLTFLTNSGEFSSTQFLKTAQGGTEPTSGTGVLTT